MNLSGKTTEELRQQCEGLRRSVAQWPDGPDVERYMSDLQIISAEIRRRTSAARNEQQPPTQGMNQ